MTEPAGIETTSGYTPMTDEVKALVEYGAQRYAAGNQEVERVLREGFDRWLLSVRAEAWDEGVAATIQSPQDPHAHPDWWAEHNPYRDWP